MPVIRQHRHAAAKVSHLGTVLHSLHLLSTACVIYTDAGDNAIHACTHKLRALLKVTEKHIRTQDSNACASLLTPCCLCPQVSSSLTPSSSRKTLSKKRQLQREARIILVHIHTCKRGGRLAAQGCSDRFGGSSTTTFPPLNRSPLS